jgi:hypothetical protein
MGGSALLHTISLTALLVVVLLTVFIVLVLESADHPPARNQEAALPSEEPGEATAPEREAA